MLNIEVLVAKLLKDRGDDRLDSSLEELLAIELWSISVVWLLSNNEVFVPKTTNKRKIAIVNSVGRKLTLYTKK